MVPEDELSLQRVFKMEALPQHVLDEGDRWTRAFHADGNHSGPMGTVAMIALGRLCGLELPDRRPSPQQSKWNDVPTGTAVEVRFFGEWQAGTLVGRAPNGALCVRLQSDGAVRECYSHMVRLPGQFPEPEPKPIGPPGQDDPASAAAIEPPPPPEAFTMQAEPYDWASAAKGLGVWAEINGDLHDGKFERIGTANENGVQTVFVTLDDDGEIREVPASRVTAAT